MIPEHPSPRFERQRVHAERPRLVLRGFDVAAIDRLRVVGERAQRSDLDTLRWRLGLDCAGVDREDGLGRREPEPAGAGEACRCVIRVCRDRRARGPDLVEMRGDGLPQRGAVAPTTPIGMHHDRGERSSGLGRHRVEGRRRPAHEPRFRRRLPPARPRRGRGGLDPEAHASGARDIVGIRGQQQRAGGAGVVAGCLGDHIGKG